MSKQITLQPGQAVTIRTENNDKGIPAKVFGSLLRAVDECWETSDVERAQKLADKIATRPLSRAQLVELAQYLITTGAAGLAISEEVEAALRSMLTVRRNPNAVSAAEDEASAAAMVDTDGDGIPDAEEAVADEEAAVETEPETETETEAAEAQPHVVEVTAGVTDDWA